MRQYLIRKRNNGEARTQAHWFPVYLPELDRAQIVARHHEWCNARPVKERSVNGVAVDGKFLVWRNPLREGDLLHDEFLVPDQQERLVEQFAEALGGTVQQSRPEPKLCIPFIHGEFARRCEDDSIERIVELLTIGMQFVIPGRVCFGTKVDSHWRASNIGGVIVSLPADTTAAGGMLIADMLDPLGETTIYGTFKVSDGGFEVAVLNRMNSTAPVGAADDEPVFRL